MYRATTLLFVFMITIMMGACAAPINHATPSGRPEVTIRGRVSSQVQSEVMNLMINRKYSVKSSSVNILVFEKPIEGTMAAVLFGSQYNTTPHARATFNIFEVGDSTRVVASFAAITNPGSSFERTTSLDNNPESANYQTRLDEIKQRIEAGK